MGSGSSSGGRPQQPPPQPPLPSRGLEAREVAARVRRVSAPGILLGRPLRFADEVPSTNDVALDWALAGAPEGATVIASTQTRGRGRSGKTWVSEPGGGLWFSVILHPGLTYPAAGMLPLVLGFGLALALRDHGLSPRLKWPNDVLVEGRKVAGILVEGRLVGDRLETAVAGVGVNWLAPQDPGLADRATGLAAELTVVGEPLPSPEDVFAGLLVRMERAYLILKTAGTSPFTQAWPEFSAHYGRMVRVGGRGDGQAPSSGLVLAGSLLPDGSLEVIRAGGGRGVLTCGEVGLDLRP